MQSKEPKPKKNFPSREQHPVRGINSSNTVNPKYSDFQKSRAHWRQGF